jgi:hypothetical protein
MVKYLPLSAEMLNPCSNTQLAATPANTPSDIAGTFGIGLDPATCGRFPSAEAWPAEYNAGGLICGLRLIDTRLWRRR